jgi:hypothetical protein
MNNAGLVFNEFSNGGCPRFPTEYAHTAQTVQPGGRDWNEILQEFMESLSDIDREIFAMYLANISFQDISAIINMDEATVRARISRIVDENKYQTIPRLHAFGFCISIGNMAVFAGLCGRSNETSSKLSCRRS